MIILAGTVPYKTGLYVGPAQIDKCTFSVGGVSFPIERGTAAMAAACASVCRFYSLPAPMCILGGEVADGKGTELMFEELNAHVEQYNPKVITLHYLFPKLSFGEPFVAKVNSLKEKPQLIADAGGMYLMKTINAAPLFDLFTPDRGELCFLADEFAPHPLYVRQELLNEQHSVESLIEAAYKNKNAAKTLLIKGAEDIIFTGNKKVNELSNPQIPAMEAIGGTGDTITGMVSAFRYKKDPDAEYKSLVINRLIGSTIRCNPATQITEFINALPEVLALYEKSIS